jgi:hypothetical protein
MESGRIALDDLQGLTGVIRNMNNTGGDQSMGRWDKLCR